MIQSALGPSPMEKNARSLAAILSSGSLSRSANARAAAWAVEAFRRAGADEVRVEKFGDPPRSENVIAVIRGRDKPQDYILFAAILDGSAPNQLLAAESAAVLIDAVRVIHRTGNIPRRSIRFVLFGTAGNGRDARLAGVWAYVRAHRSDLDRVAAAISLGPADGHLNGFSLESRPDALIAVRQALEPLRPLGIRNFTQRVIIPAALTPFWLEGVPTLVAISNLETVGQRLMPTRSNTAPRSISPAKVRDLKRRVAVAAVAAYALADAEARVAPQQSRAQVDKAINSMRLIPKLVSAGQLSTWQSAESSESH
ncbi:MAG: hypothetical protein ACRD4R_16990 [Candidatus Acidiferrales bacterium]